MGFNKASLLVFAGWTVLFSLVGFTIAYNFGNAPPIVSHAAFDIEQGPGSGLNADYLDGMDSSELINSGGVSRTPGRYYDSGWVLTTGTGQTTKTHNLGGTPESYIVDLKCYNSSGNLLSDGTFTSSSVHARWLKLSSTQIVIERLGGSGPCENGVRVQIYRMD